MSTFPINTLKQLFPQAQPSELGGNQNNGIRIFLNEPPIPSILFKLPKITEARTVALALKEGEHHGDIYENLSTQTKKSIPEYFGHFIDEQSGAVVIAMEKIDGESLINLFKAGKLTSKEVFAYYRNNVIPLLNNLVEDGFYHADPNLGNVIHTDLGDTKLVDIDLRRTFLFLKYREQLNTLLKHRRSVALHVKNKKTLAASESSRIIPEVKALMLADTKRSLIQFTLLTPKETDSPLLQQAKTMVYKWMNKPKNRTALEIWNTVTTYQPFYNLDGKTFPKRIMDWVRR
jgi:hypothetical protein